MSRELIYHITTEDEWEEAREDGEYTSPSLESEGFIHCSTHSQVLESADNFFPHREELKVLEVDPSKLSNLVRYEDVYGEGQTFPHVFGEINLEAVRRVLTIERNSNGKFQWIDENS